MAVRLVFHQHGMGRRDASYQLADPTWSHGLEMETLWWTLWGVMSNNHWGVPHSNSWAAVDLRDVSSEASKAAEGEFTHSAVSSAIGKLKAFRV